MAYIKCQFNAPAGVAPVDMPTYDTQISALTHDNDPASATWITTRTGYFSIGSTTLYAEFQTASGTSSDEVTARAHLKLVNTYDVSATSKIQLKAKLYRANIDSTHWVQYTVNAMYKGNVVASSTPVKYTSSNSTPGEPVIEVDLSGVSRIDEIRLDMTRKGRNSSGVQGYAFTTGNYIKFV